MYLPGTMETVRKARSTRKVLRPVRLPNASLEPVLTSMSSVTRLRDKMVPIIRGILNQIRSISIDNESMSSDLMA